MLFQQFVLKTVLFQQFVLGPVKITDYMLDIRLIDEGAILPEEEENSPSQAAEAAFSNLSRKKTMHLLKRARRNAQVEKERAAAVVTSSRLQPLDWSAYDSWRTGPPEDDGGMDSSRWCNRRSIPMFEGLGYGARYNFSKN